MGDKSRLAMPDGTCLGQAGRYVIANGVRTYYEVHGEGEPLMLLHGGLATVESLASLAPGLSRHFRVILPERRGHGRSQDIPGPFRYEDLADDAAALMEALKVPRAHVTGWSDGANTGLHLALRHPGRALSLVSIGGNYHAVGVTPETFNNAMELSWDALPAKARDLLMKASPESPDYFPAFVERTKVLWLTSPALTREDLKAVTAPVLVMIGQDDAVTIEHAADFFRSLPRGQLAVVPGATHFVHTEKPALVIELILDFIRGTRHQCNTDR